MNAVCPNPLCGTSYNLTPQHMGRQFVCRKCGAVLAAEADGLHLVSSAAAPGQPAAAAPSGGFAAAPADPTAPAAAGGGLAGRVPFDPAAVMNQLRNNVWTVLFGAGAFLVIVFLFFPLLDKMKVDRRAAAIELGNLKQQQAEAELNRRPPDKQPTAAERDEVKKRREAWDKERVSLDDEVAEARIDLRTSGYWYTWGMMFGFLMLGLASVGWLNPNEIRSRRVVASIIICSILLLIFITYVAMSTGARL